MLAVVGRKFYGIAMVGMGLLIIYYHDFPYMLIPPKHTWIPALALVSDIFGALIIFAGTCIVLEKGTRTISLLLAIVFLLIFCFYFIPYQLIAGSKIMQLGSWENPEKELALSCGAFVVAGGSSKASENKFIKLLCKLILPGTILFGFIIMSFGMDHFLYANEAADYVPSWVPHHLLWIYVGGVALTGSGISIVLRIGARVIATLLGAMIFTWFVILHVPYVVAAHFADTGGEVTSALLALAYSGTAFAIAGAAKKSSWKHSGHS